MYPLLALTLVLAVGMASLLGTARAMHQWAASQHYSYELASTGEGSFVAVLERGKLVMIRQ